MNKSPRLGIPYISESQAQKEVTHNEMVTRADMLIQSAVLAILNDPPDTPQEGDCYLTGQTPTGAWDGKADHLAEFIGTTWIYLAPQEGWRVYNREDQQTYCYQRGSWTAVTDIAKRSVQIGVEVQVGSVLSLQVDGTYGLADNSAADTVQDLVMVIGATGITGVVIETGTVIVSEEIALTIGAPLYLGTAGGFTQTAPTESGKIVKCIGWAIGSHTIKFRPDSFGLQLA